MKNEKHIDIFFENLSIKLKNSGVNKNIYSLRRRKEDTTCLNFKDNKWIVEKEEEKIMFGKQELVLNGFNKTKR